VAGSAGEQSRANRPTLVVVPHLVDRCSGRLACGDPLPAIVPRHGEPTHAGDRHRHDGRGGPSRARNRAAPSQTLQQRRHRCEAIVRIGRQAALHDATKPVRHIGATRGSAEVALEDRSREVEHRGAGEWALAEQRLPQHDAERKLIAARIGVLAGELLRGHVCGRARRGTQSGHPISDAHLL
jgi:hypothetical protein